MPRFLAALLLSVLTAATTLASEKPMLLASNEAGHLLPSPDALIAKTLQDIRDSRMDDALKEVNQVISIRPDFKLAYLIRGDLLLAHSRPIFGLGSGHRSSQSLTDLREEARVRLLRYIDQPDAGSLPRQILQLAPDQKYALLADASRARLYVFENVNGEPRLLRDYYMTIGRNGTYKKTEGDLRTPAGIYQIAEHLPKNRLSDFYGAGAYPLNYPNDWDLAQGREGHGIWLHGVPSNTYSRPPRSSEGCVVVANPDLKEIGRLLQPGITPIVIAERADWVERMEWDQSREELMAAINAWKTDWEARDADRFFEHYSSSILKSRGWVESKRRNITDKNWIKLNLEDMSLFLYPSGDMAYADFTQNYTSDRLTSSSHKHLYLRREQGHWHIALEKAVDLPTRMVQR